MSHREFGQWWRSGIVRVFGASLMIAVVGASPVFAAGPCCTTLTKVENTTVCTAATVNSITAFGGPNAYELTCRINWNYNYTGTCSGPRDIRYCAILRSGSRAGSPPSCADAGTYINTQCVDAVPTASGSNITRDFTFGGLVVDEDYYCTIAAIDIQGASCTACGNTCGTNQNPCDNVLAGGKGTCGNPTPP